MGQILDIFLHLDQHLNQAVATLGSWFYALLFGIVFCETDLVVPPVPARRLAALRHRRARRGRRLGGPCRSRPGCSSWPLLGDAVNYQIGLHAGPKIFHREDSRWLDKKHLKRTQAFYDKDGAKAIVLARSCRSCAVARRNGPKGASSRAMSWSRAPRRRRMSVSPGWVKYWRGGVAEGG